MKFLAVLDSFLASLVGLVVIILAKLSDVVMVPQNIKIIIKLYSYMGDLEVKTKSLRAKKEVIDRIIVNNGKLDVYDNSPIEVWKKHVGAIMPEIQTLVDYYKTRGRHHRGFSFICSNYLAGMECANKLEKVKDLLKRGSFFGVVTVESDSLTPTPTTYEVPGSLEPNYAESFEYVQSDNLANIIGIWGMGGVGKTTLMSKIHNSCLQLSLFDRVIWVVASGEITLKKVQREIAQKLRLPENDDTRLQAHIIFNFLHKKNFLLFIDDLWETIDLKQVGVPNSSVKICGKKHKVVFTTRSQFVCSDMEAEKIIKVDCLDDEQSWVLFKEKVGERVIQSHPRISALAVDVARECKGLPLALIVIGRAMSTKRSSREWEYSLYLLRKSHSRALLGAEMLQILKIGYDSLASEKLQKCFLSISMWPENFEIRKDKIIECWMGLDIIDNFESMTDAYLTGFSLIRNLQAACLLEDVEKNLDFNDGREYVKMHHVLRDLALYIASNCGKNENKWIVKAGFQLKRKPSIGVKWDEAECISLMQNKIKELPSDICSCPNLLTLVLRQNSLRSKSQLNCFHNFHSLKCLDLCENELMFFPESVCALKELQYLNLSHNSIVNIPEKLGNLKKLKYLILKENRIRNVPRGVFSKLPKLLVMDLFSSFTYSLVNVEEVECLEKKLLYLGMTVRANEELNKLMLCPNLPIQALCIDGLHDISFDFMSRIPNLYTSNHRHCLKKLSFTRGGVLEIVFSKNKHKDLPSLNLDTLLLYDLFELRRIIWRDITPKNIFVELREIRVFGCKLLEDVTWVIHLPLLHTLDIKGCESMKIVINDAENETNTHEVNPTVLTFPSLKRLTLNDLEKLEEISTRPFALPQLERLQVSGCPLLKTMPFDSITNPRIRLLEGGQNWWKKLVLALVFACAGGVLCAMTILDKMPVLLLVFVYAVGFQGIR